VSTPQQQVRHGFTYLLPVLVGNLAPIVTLPIFTRILRPADYGAWALATAYATFAAVFASLGLTSAYERNFFEQSDVRSQAALLYTLLGFVVVAMFLVGAATWLFQATIARNVIGDAAFGSLVVWTYCAVAITNVKAYYLIYFKNAEDASAYVKYSIAETILGTLASLTLVAWFHLGILGVVWGQLAASSLVTAALVVRFLRSHPPRFDVGLLSGGLRMGVPLIPRLFVNVAGNQLDKYLIGLVSSVSSVGLFTIGQRIANFAFAYMTALENVFVPQVYKRMFALGDTGGTEIGRYLTPFAYVSAAISLLIALFAEEALFVLTAPEFRGAASIASLLAVSYGLMFFRKQPQLLFRKATLTISAFSTIAVLINVAVSVPMIMAWGGLGAAAGALVAALLAGIAHYAISQRVYRIRYEAVPLAAVFGTLVLAGALAVALRELHVDYPVRLGAKLVCLAAYVWLGMQIGVITPGNLAMAKAAVWKVR